MTLLRSSPCICASSGKTQWIMWYLYVTPFLLSVAKRNFYPDVQIRKNYQLNFLTSFATLWPRSVISVIPQCDLQLLQNARRFVHPYIGPITILLSTRVCFAALLQPTATLFPIILDKRMLLHCVRWQPIISSSHQGLVALFWKPPAELLITLYLLYILCGIWRYFLPYQQLRMD